MQAYPNLARILSTKNIDIEATNNGIHRLGQYLADAIVNSRHQGVLDEINQNMNALMGNNDVSLVVSNDNGPFPPQLEVKNLEQDCLYAMTKGWPGEWKNEPETYIVLASSTVAALMAIGNKENNINHTATILFKHLLQERGLDALEQCLATGKVDGFLSSAISAVQVLAVQHDPAFTVSEGIERLRTVDQSTKPSAADLFRKVMEPYQDKLATMLSSEMSPTP